MLGQNKKKKKVSRIDTEYLYSIISTLTVFFFTGNKTATVKSSQWLKQLLWQKLDALVSFSDAVFL